MREGMSECVRKGVCAQVNNDQLPIVKHAEC